MKLTAGTLDDLYRDAPDPLPGQGELFDREFCLTWHDNAPDTRDAGKAGPQ